MRVMRQRRVPGGELGGDADAGSEMLRSRRDRQRRFRGGAVEQQVLEEHLVVEGHIGDQHENVLKVAEPQQVGLARDEPHARGSPLAPGTVPVATAGIGDRQCPQSSQVST